MSYVNPEMRGIMVMAKKTGRKVLETNQEGQWMKEDTEIEHTPLIIEGKRKD